MSKIIITVEYTYDDIPEHEAAREADELVESMFENPGEASRIRINSVRVIHQEEGK
jgi:hypothetical protein